MFNPGERAHREQRIPVPLPDGVGEDLPIPQPEAAGHPDTHSRPALQPEDRLPDGAGIHPHQLLLAQQRGALVRDKLNPVQAADVPAQELPDGVPGAQLQRHRNQKQPPHHDQLLQGLGAAPQRQPHRLRYPNHNSAKLDRILV